MKVRYVRWYADEWLAGTAELDATERGVFATIINLIYSRGGPIKNDRDLMRLCNVHGNTFNRIMRRLIDLGKVIENGPEITVKRCENELETSQNRSRNALENGRKGGRPSSNNNGIAEPDGLQSEKLTLTNKLRTKELKTKSISSDLRSDLTDEGFQKFYEVYPRHEARRAAERAWKAALKRAPPETIIAGAERYAEQREGEDKQYTKLPASWLNGDCWADGVENETRRYRPDSEITQEEREAAIREWEEQRRRQQLFVAVDNGEISMAR